MWNPTNFAHCEHVMFDLLMRVNRKTPRSFIESTYNNTTWASYNYGGFLGAFYNKQIPWGSSWGLSAELSLTGHTLYSQYSLPTDCHCKISLNWSFKQFHKLLKKHQIEMVMKTLPCVGQKNITSIMEIWYPQKIVRQEYYGFLLSQEQSWL